MHNMKIRKLAGVLAAAIALTALPISASATEAGNKKVNLGGNKDGEAPKDGAFTADDPAGRYGLSPANVSTTGVALSVTDSAIDGGGINTDIAVWGYTKDGIVYSVDVEWGAMTFQYELSSWDPEEHKAKDGGGWGVYDAANEKRLGNVQDAINRITVTNHSNAEVAANLSYESVTSDAIEADYKDIKGMFTKNKDTDKNPVPDRGGANGETVEVTPTEGICDIKLPTAVDTALEEAPRASVYFMPKSDTAPVAGTIDKWTKIGVITVKLQTVPDVP